MRGPILPKRGKNVSECLEAYSPSGTCRAVFTTVSS